MSHRNIYFLATAIIVLLVLIFFVPSFGWRLRSILNPQNNTADQNVQSLTAQNEVLQAELAQFQVIASELPQAPSGTIRAMVYSQYPLNFRSELLVNAGSSDGVQVGKAVTFQGAFVGIVQKVFSNYSVVQTIFDPAFKMPVSIGSSGADALLQGGDYPQAVSIAKSATISVGDIVYSAAPGIPYALPVGQVAGVAVAPNNLFQQATLNFAYDLNSVQTVAIEE